MLFRPFRACAASGPIDPQGDALGCSRVPFQGTGNAPRHALSEEPACGYRQSTTKRLSRPQKVSRTRFQSHTTRRIRPGTGQNYRLIILLEKSLELLRESSKAYKPANRLFIGPTTKCSLTMMTSLCVSLGTSTQVQKVSVRLVGSAVAHARLQVVKYSSAVKHRLNTLSARPTSCDSTPFRRGKNVLNGAMPSLQ